jgi:hypothetical protein
LYEDVLPDADKVEDADGDLEGAADAAAGGPQLLDDDLPDADKRRRDGGDEPAG